MKQVLALALKGLGLVSPNPLVGALIVDKGRVLATGYHARFGADHAEIDALKKIKFKAPGATLYCNLEPCCHQGKTPPCVDQVIASGIKRVVIAQTDPNPKVNGRSIKILKKNGIEVVVGICEAEARYINRFFNTYHEKKRPYIVAKLAVSADGFFAPLVKSTNKPFWITGVSARTIGHYWRAITDAILVGAQTVRDDTPSLLPRLKTNTLEPQFISSFTKQKGIAKQLSFSELKKSKPLRLVLTSDASSLQSWFKQEINKGPIRFLHQIRKQDLLQKDQDRFVSSILVEGGAQTILGFLKKGLVDELLLFRSQKKLRFGASAQNLLMELNNKQRFKVNRFKIGTNSLLVYSSLG